MRVVCIGAGKLAHHLIPALEHDAGCHIVQVFNRSASSAVLLAEKLKSAVPITHEQNIDPYADLYFITVADDAVQDLARRIHSKVNPSGIVVHCSGSLGLDVLPFEHRGIFYPLQSFSENQPTDWANTPIIITSNEDYVSARLSALAIKMTQRVTHMTEDEKSILHVAAVFANNFSNHMLTLAESICEENDIDFEIIKPLIKTTFEKALASGPVQSQTGPAIRRDQHTLEKHMDLLEGHPDLMELYRLLSKSIRKFSAG